MEGLYPSGRACLRGRRGGMFAAMDASTSPADLVVSRAYHELRAIAHHRLSARGRGGTLSTTALVHEAYLKLADESRAEWNDRAHFLAVASLAMRHVIVDRAREPATPNRGGALAQVPLDVEKTA